MHPRTLYDYHLFASKICLYLFIIYFDVDRATGMAISMVAARLGGIIGNIVIAALLDIYCPLPTYIVAGLLIGLL